MTLHVSSLAVPVPRSLANQTIAVATGFIHFHLMLFADHLSSIYKSSLVFFVDVTVLWRLSFCFFLLCILEGNSPCTISLFVRVLFDFESIFELNIVYL